MILALISSVVAFFIGYGVAVWRISRSIKNKIAALDAQLKANISKMQAAILKNK